MKGFKSEIMIHRLGEILKDRGARKGLADAIGTSPSVISELCSGNDRLNEDWIEKISHALGIPAWHLFADPDTVYPYEDQKIVTAYKALPEKVREVIDMLLFNKIAASEKIPTISKPANPDIKGDRL